MNFNKSLFVLEMLLSVIPFCRMRANEQTEIAYSDRATTRFSCSVAEFSDGHCCRPAVVRCIDHGQVVRIPKPTEVIAMKGTGRSRGGWGQIVKVGVVALIISSGCGGGDTAMDAADEHSAAVGKAKRATEKLIGKLMGEVQKSIKEVGLAGTVTHCANRAQELGTLVGAEEGVVIRRVTEKTRNPLDAPDTFERRIITRFAVMAQRGELDASTVHMEVVKENDREMLRYFKPITIKKPCLGCHGPAESIAPEVRQALRKHYPSDRATGYSVGDLRGIVSVIVPLDEE